MSNMAMAGRCPAFDHFYKNLDGDFQEAANLAGFVVYKYGIHISYTPPGPIKKSA